jgi:hypothetical protein
METQDQQCRPAGWYPDPDHAGTQRFWDGRNWTDQRAPLGSVGPSASPRLIAGVLGGAAAAIAVFLPRVDSPTSLHIADNSVISTDFAVGGLVLLLAAGAVMAVFRDPTPDSVNPWLFVAGLLVLGVAIYYGTGDRLELVTTSLSGGLFGGQHFSGSPGVGLYIMGVGGALIMGAGFLKGAPERVEVG